MFLQKFNYDRKQVQTYSRDEKHFWSVLIIIINLTQLMLSDTSLAFSLFS